ncbi:putative acetyltransferase At3g50280 [Castanea sativa]|uniref:putative acetyltransferase At3g50280 n=1 Tax=Castanea sativa TaxID=21020 RepID=UPI003F64984E
MSTNPPKIRYISESFIKPQYASEESKRPLYLTPWDLAMLSENYTQKGLLFTKPPAANAQEDFIKSLLEKLKQSLSEALVHFYPLSGRLVTQKNENPPSSLIFVDCNNSPGAKFIYADLDLIISDILSPIDVPSIVQSFFDHDRAVNYDGHTMPLLSIQVTELKDGIFIGCSMNHCIGDGTSYWHFFNTWSEIFQAQGNNISITRPPIHKRWFPDGVSPILNLPFTHQDEFISRVEAPKLRERIFQFSSQSIAKLKEKSNAESNTNKISSFQTLPALVWRCITRARCLPHDQITRCRLATNNRSRMEPSLSNDYFGNSLYAVGVVTTAGELLEHNLGWAAWKLHEAVANHSDKVVRDFFDIWLQSPFVLQPARIFDPYSVMMGSSPRFNMYGNEFGMGKAVALCSGYANKFDGKVSSYPGYEGGGSIDLEVCLSPDSMSALESDKEFMDAVSLSYQLH